MTNTNCDYYFLNENYFTTKYIYSKSKLWLEKVNYHYICQHQFAVPEESGMKPL
jgi:hypothetical protein